MASLADLLSRLGSTGTDTKRSALEALSLLEPVVARAAAGAVRNGLALKGVAERHHQLEELTGQVREASRALSDGICAAGQAASRTAQISLRVSEVSAAGGGRDAGRPDSGAADAGNTSDASPTARPTAAGRRPRWTRSAPAWARSRSLPVTRNWW